MQLLLQTNEKDEHRGFKEYTTFASQQGMWEILNLPFSFFTLLIIHFSIHEQLIEYYSVHDMHILLCVKAQQ